MKKVIVFAIIISSVACSSTQKKVLVYAKGTATVNESTKTIIASDGAGSDEKTLLLTDKAKTSINIETTNAKASRPSSPAPNWSPRGWPSCWRSTTQAFAPCFQARRSSASGGTDLCAIAFMRQATAPIPH